MWIVNGEIDFHNRHVSIANYSLFKENEANGDYQVMLGVSASPRCAPAQPGDQGAAAQRFFNT